MIFVTGDTHIPHDIHKLNTANFLEQKSLTKGDFVLISGDFGGVWDNSTQDKYWCNWLDSKSFTTLFIDGNHENHFLLSQYPVDIWNGGKVHYITDSIIHLIRGQVYNINGIKVFTFGGAASIDIAYRKEGVSWWKEEIPSEEEKLVGRINLDANNWDVDFVISHTCPESIMEKYLLMQGLPRYYIDYSTEEYLEQIKAKLKYKNWFFGHYHDDRTIDSKHTLIYKEIHNLDWYISS